MDIFSHGLWGGVALGRKQKSLYWWSFGFGMMPDLLSFGVYTVANFFSLVSGPEWNPALIPQSVHVLYSITHSFVIFVPIFGLVWFLRKKPFLPLLAWSLHILVDIPTHSASFFPTPFLWPVSNIIVDGVSWARPIVFYPDVVLLVVVYLVWWINSRRNRR